MQFVIDATSSFSNLVLLSSYGGGATNIRHWSTRRWISFFHSLTALSASTVSCWAALLCATQTRTAREEAAKGDRAISIDEGCGKMLLAGVDIERGVEECEETGTRGYVRVVSGRVRKKSRQRS